MNFLAHFHLAWPDEGLIAGGLEGDYYKGPLHGELPPDVERGIQLHRAIDAYTDAHPLIAQLRDHFPPGLRRYAGILIDLSFDHYLSHHWHKFSDLPLQEFSRGVYRTLASHEHALSEGYRTMAGRMAEHDILGLYRDWEMVPASAARVGQRFKRGNPLTAVGAQLAPVRRHLERAFLAFYPQLQAFSARHPAALNHAAVAASNIALPGKSP